MAEREPAWDDMRRNTEELEEERNRISNAYLAFRNLTEYGMRK